MYGDSNVKEPSIVLFGGIGEQKSNSGTQFYQQDRIYDSDGIATSLSAKLPGGGQMYSIYLDDEIEVKGERMTENNEKPGMYVEIAQDLTVYAVWYPAKQCYVAIRKLTPRECFRLQGWSDEYFEKAEFMNSDSQLFKQAGNGVTVNVVEVIGKRLNEVTEGGIE